MVASYGLVSWPSFGLRLGSSLLLARGGLVVTRGSMRRDDDDEEQPEFLRRIMPLLPYGSVLAAAVLPLAAGLYLLVSTAWAAGERAFLHRPALAGH